MLRRQPDARFDVLLGLRARRSRFMPGNLAFPGGRLDPEDAPGSTGAFARCASREVREETGLDLPPSVWHAAGERTTPPIFPVRYRTLFFVAELPDGSSLPPAPPSPDELETLAFADPRAVLVEWEAGASLVPPPLLPILRLLAKAGATEAGAVAASVATINRDEDAAPRIEFTPGTWVLPVRTRTLPPASCTNIWMPGGRRFVVIDPGSNDPGELTRLSAVVARRVAAGDRVEAVVLTHHHRDHVEGAAHVASALRVPVYGHPETLARLSLPANVATRSLADRDTIELDGLTLLAVHTPGHAPGHLAFFDARRRVLIAGDLVSGLSTILVGFADGDMDAYLDSLRRCAALDPMTVLPSHGPPLPGASLAAALTHRKSREGKILEALADGASHELAAIAASAYAGADVMLPLLSELQTRAHLDRLCRHGVVGKDGERYYGIAGGMPGTSIES